ncbi:hypothetical protein ZWY2020_052041 [Hordeum vulgare]|nr:hypothetical protein ZWY2020_052041 [Hordeum vulgare]
MRLNALAQSALLVEDSPIGPACFGLWNQREPSPQGFTMPRDTPKGNKRVAVRYVPLMLAGSTRTWLNSLPAGSVNSWVDFEEAFVRNFIGIYKRPGRPRELAMCVEANDLASDSSRWASFTTLVRECMRYMPSSTSSTATETTLSSSTSSCALSPPL